MKALAAACCLASPAVAQDVPAWEGYWSVDTRWCANAGNSGENTPDWYGRDGLFGLEWSCDIRSVSEIGVGQSWALQIDCLDAGYAYRDAKVFLLTPNDRLLVFGEDGRTTNMVRCEVKP